MEASFVNMALVVAHVLVAGVIYSFIKGRRKPPVGCANAANENRPSLTYTDGNRTVEEYWQNGVKHRENGPAVKHVEGTGWIEEYWVNGEKHREGGPAVIVKKVDGSERVEFWEHGQFIDHRQTRKLCSFDEYPERKTETNHGTGVFVSEKDNGTRKEEHYLDGKLHCTTGPARIVTAPDGSVWKEFWENGELISAEREIRCA